MTTLVRRIRQAVTAAALEIALDLLITELVGRGTAELRRRVGADR